MSEHPSSPTADGLLVRGGVVAGRYRLERPIATGGMATVWQAVDTVLTRSVAIKVLHAQLADDPDFVARFRREAVASARLAHPNIVAIYDTCDDPEAIVMELVEGRTLRDELDRRSFVPAAEAVAVGSAVCEALSAAHRAGIVHRDIKPANVLLAADGRLKVADFGIAKASSPPSSGAADPGLPDVTTVGKMVGTAKYVAPEQVSGGTVDARSDIYALGVVLYEMVCGRPPFTGENDLAVATARLHGRPERPTSVLRTIPTRCEEIIMRALEPDPDDRYQSADAMWADLQSCPTEDVSPPASVADGTLVEDAPSFTATERSWLVPAGLVSLIGVALVLAWMLLGGTQARRDLFDLVERVAPDLGATRGQAEEELEVTARSFDPLGDGSEHDDVAALAVDGDETTTWRTERYETRQFGALKAGVGLVLDLGGTRALSELTTVSASEGWSMEVYVADRFEPALQDWGVPAATITGATTGTITTELTDASGSHVLLWLTDLGTGPGVIFELAEATVMAEA